MGTRAGDMDPAIPLHMMGRLGLSAKDMDTVLNKKSGLLGVCVLARISSIANLAEAQRQSCHMMPHFQTAASKARIHLFQLFDTSATTIWKKSNDLMRPCGS